MSTKRKYICIHGHFYQPPRENAWLETIESQPSAAPFHDWNDRINFECYASNAAARVLNQEQLIRAISNNYERISFNFGPTLLSWLAAEDPETYSRILAADRGSRKRFGGHGSAVAQVYNHLIMPLANERDRHSQIIWGIADFEYRFGRKPEGMWLGETAANTPTLEALVDHGITYTILAPRQAKAVRHLGAAEWHTVNENTLDTRRAYRCNLPSGRFIDIFFYDGMVARAVAFEGLLNDGKLLANKLMATLDQDPSVQIAQIATDGESYGHHHRKGEMALAACLNHIEENPHFELTNYGQFLELNPPEWACEIHENSSWSCVHGVERWRSNCGCHTGGEAHWNQQWRAPLRACLDFVREQCGRVFEGLGADLFTDPWKARDAYISVVLHKNKAQRSAFLLEQTTHKQLSHAQEIQMLRLLEMQRHCMLMYTSCGWFFNEVSGIETLQILQYALRALHLLEVLTGTNHEPTFRSMLENTPSNIHRNAVASYVQHVIPAKVGLQRVAMHYAASTLFEEEPEKLDLFTYAAKSEQFTRLRAGNQRLSIGCTTFTNTLTSSSTAFAFACLYIGQQSVIGHITSELPPQEHSIIVADLEKRMREGDLAYLLSGLREYFGDETFSLWHLFRDEKHRILNMISEQSLVIASKSFSNVYYENYQLMSSLQDNNLALPAAYVAAIAFTLRRRLLSCLRIAPLDLRRLQRIVADCEHWNHEWERSTSAELGKATEEAVLREMKLGLAEPLRLVQCLELLRLAKRVKLQPNYWQTQNVFLQALEQQVDHLVLGVQIEDLLALGKELNIVMYSKLPAHGQQALVP